MSFEKLYRENYKLVYGYLINLCKNENIAEELTSQTFVKALQYYKSYKEKGSASAWLCQIAKHEYFKFLNKQKRIDKSQELENIYDNSSVEEMIADKDIAMQIHKHLHILSEPYKEVFVLKVFAELSYGEIADIFEKTESWARVTYYRAKVKLIERMEDSNEN